MPHARAVAHTPAVVERRPASAARPARSAAAPSGAAALRQRLGNAGAHAVLARASREVSSPHDAAEVEARATARMVMRMEAPQPRAAPVAAVSRDGGGEPAGGDVVTSAHLSGGSPLSAEVRGFMEPRFGADFGAVRVHTDSQAASLSERLHANAFTVGPHVFFGAGQYRPDSNPGRELIAHELTHTLQHGAAVRREAKSSWWEDVTNFGAKAGMALLQEVAPSLVPIAQRGPGGLISWLKDKAAGAVEAGFNALARPVRAIAGVGGQLQAQFAPLAAAVQTAAAQIARNDCTPLREAAAAIEKTALSIITPIVEKLQPVVAKVKDLLNTLWDKVGAPAWEWIKQYAAEQWAMVQAVAGHVRALGGWLWDNTAVVRGLAEKAWVWVKNQLGIGEGPEGTNGLLQWVQRQQDAAWAWIKEKIEPFKKELATIGLTVAAVALAVSPAGPVLAVGAAVAGAVQGLRWIAANWGKGNLIVQARSYLEKQLIPPLLGAAQRLGGAVTRLAASLSDTLGRFAGALGKAAGALAGSLLRAAVAAVQWVADQAAALAAWARQQLGAMAQGINAAVGRLRAFLNQMLELFAKVGKVVLDVWGLPVLLGEKVWNWLPACIRDPIVDFIGPIILRQIELFSELARDDAAWQKTKADIGRLIKLVFKDHDLMGAVKAAFHLVLRVFNVPMELLETVAKKAMAAWDVVVKKPIAFIKNTVRAIGHGFRLLWANLWSHLEFGLQGWLFGELQEKSITPPASWTDPKALFTFALQVMGLTVDHMWELLARRFDPDKVKAARARIGQVASALAWIHRSIDTSKSPKENAQGLWDQAKDFGKTVLNGIAEWVVAKVAEELAIMAAAAAASGGLSEVLDVLRRVYKALLTARRYARRIVDMANQTLDNVLDIADGAVEKVGVKFEQIMRRGMPVVIGFLAEQAGLGGVGAAIRGIVEKLRAQVDRAVLWLIDKMKAAFEAVVGAVSAGVAKIAGWLGLRKEFTVDGEPHALYFTGSEAKAQLVVASTPRPIEQFLREKEPETVGDATKRAAWQAIDMLVSKVRPKIDAAAAASASGKDNTPLQREIEGLMNQMAPHIVQLLSDLEWGTPENPAPIEYQKRRAEAYPTFYLATGKLKSLDQAQMRQRYASQSPAAKADEKIYQALPTRTTTLPGEPPLGLGSASQVEVGKAVEFDEKGKRGGGVGSFKAMIGRYGLVASTAGWDVDHVIELQIGGRDEFSNLWPLPASENRSSGSLIKNATTKPPGKQAMKVTEAVEEKKKPRSGKKKPKSSSLWLIVTTTRQL